MFNYPFFPSIHTTTQNRTQNPQGQLFLPIPAEEPKFPPRNPPLLDFQAVAMKSSLGRDPLLPKERLCQRPAAGQLAPPPSLFHQKAFSLLKSFGEASRLGVAGAGPGWMQYGAYWEGKSGTAASSRVPLRPRDAGVREGPDAESRRDRLGCAVHEGALGEWKNQGNQARKAEAVPHFQWKLSFLGSWEICGGRGGVLGCEVPRWPGAKGPTLGTGSEGVRLTPPSTESLMLVNSSGLSSQSLVLRLCGPAQRASQCCGGPPTQTQGAGKGHGAHTRGGHCACSG